MIYHFINFNLLKRFVVDLKSSHTCYATTMSALPLNELLSKNNLGSFYFNKFFIVIVDDSLLKLLFLLLCHGHWIRRWSIGLVVQRAKLIGSHVSNCPTSTTFQL